MLDLEQARQRVQELRTVIELGTDLLQGYFLARPAIVPGDIAPEAVAIIRELQRQKKD